MRVSRHIYANTDRSDGLWKLGAARQRLNRRIGAAHINIVYLSGDVVGRLIAYIYQLFRFEKSWSVVVRNSLHFGCLVFGLVF